MAANTYYLELNICFTEYFLAVEIDEQNREGRENLFLRKKKEALNNP